MAGGVWSHRSVISTDHLHEWYLSISLSLSRIWIVMVLSTSLQSCFPIWIAWSAISTPSLWTGGCHTLQPLHGPLRELSTLRHGGVVLVHPWLWMAMNIKEWEHVRILVRQFVLCSIHSLQLVWHFTSWCRTYIDIFTRSGGQVAIGHWSLSYQALDVYKKQRLIQSKRHQVTSTHSLLEDMEVICFTVCQETLCVNVHSFTKVGFCDVQAPFVLRYYLPMK